MTRLIGLLRRELLIALTAISMLPACGGTALEPQATPPAELRLGFFPNLTHATALVGIKKGFLQDALGAQTTLEPSVFSSGSNLVEALLSGSIDATYIGPNPTLTAYARSHGQAVRVISGATSGGAALVVRPGVPLKTLASPGLGSTQDVALRWWLKQNGRADEITVLPQDNSQTLQTFKSGQIDGAWVPEPWATRLVLEAGGRVLVDERDLWPAGQFVTTLLVVRTDFLLQHPETVKRLLAGHAQAGQWLNANPAEAQAAVTDYLTELTGSKLSPAVTARAWSHMTFTLDPLPATLRTAADHAIELGLLPPVDLTDLYAR